VTNHSGKGEYKLEEAGGQAEESEPQKFAVLRPNQHNPAKLAALVRAPLLPPGLLLPTPHCIAVANRSSGEGERKQTAYIVKSTTLPIRLPVPKRHRGSVVHCG